MALPVRLVGQTVGREPPQVPGNQQEDVGYPECSTVPQCEGQSKPAPLVKDEHGTWSIVRSFEGSAGRTAELLPAELLPAVSVNCKPGLKRWVGKK